MRMTRLEVAFGIVNYLFALGISKADDPSDFASVHKRNIVKNVAFGNETCHSDLIIFVSAIDPYECLFPDQFPCERQGQPVPGAVQSVSCGVKVD